MSVQDYTCDNPAPNWPILGCCPSIQVSRVWGVGLVAIHIRAEFGSAVQRERNESYLSVSAQFGAMREIVNNWPLPMEEEAEPNNVNIYTYQRQEDGTFLMDPIQQGGCGATEADRIHPFINHVPFGGMKHEPMPPISQIQTHYRASVWRMKVEIASSITRLRRRLVRHHSLGLICYGPGFSNAPEAELVVLEDETIDNPGTYEFLVPGGAVDIPWTIPNTVPTIAQGSRLLVEYLEPSTLG